MVMRARIGKNTGPGRLRRTATTRARMRTRTSAMRKIWTLIQKPLTSAGIASPNSFGSKKSCWTSGQFGALTMTSPSAPKKTTVLSTASHTVRRGSRADRRRTEGGSCDSARRRSPAPGSKPIKADRRSSRPSVAARRPAAEPLLQLRCALAGDPLLDDRREAAVRLHRREGLVDAGREGAALRQDDAEVLDVTRGWQGADDD